jgi:copper chaperone CopZ
MKKIKLKIEGMHCASCASNIERSLKKIPGIKEANVSLMTKKGIVESEKDISDEELKKAVSRTGYKLLDIGRE